MRKKDREETAAGQQKRPVSRRGGGPRGPMVQGEKARDFKGTIRKIAGCILRFRGAFLVVALCAVVSCVFNIIGPKILGGATTLLSDGLIQKIRGTGSIDFAGIGQILLRVVLLYLVGYFFGVAQGWLMASITQKVSYDLRKRISEKIDRLPMAYFEKQTVGEILSRITNDVDTMAQGMNQSVTQLITSTVKIVGVFAMMLTISPLMTGLTVVLLPLCLGLILGVMKRSQKYFKQQQDTLGEVNGLIEEVYGGQTVIQAFNKEEETLARFNETNGRLYRSAIRSQFLAGTMHPIMTLVGNLGYVAVVISGSFLAAKGSITIGDIQAFIEYVRNFTEPIQQLAQIGNMLQSMAAAAERVFEFLDEPEEAETGTAVLDTGKVVGNVSFRHVRFGYNDEVTVIRDFSAEASAGQKIAIVGPTGAGKTTLCKLLMRYYEVNSGEILLDGVNIRDYDRHSYRRAFGMVLQDTWLFKGTVMENIRFGRPDATDEEVMAAADAARATHFINTLPDGWNTMLYENADNVSAGQKQLLTIARAILADSRLMILDEATSSVDTRTEELIQEAMDTLMQGRTGFVIAHRLSTIRNADLILAVKDGDIVEQGTHDDLLAKNGFYAELYRSQFSE